MPLGEGGLRHCPPSCSVRRRYTMGDKLPKRSDSPMLPKRSIATNAKRVWFEDWNMPARPLVDRVVLGVRSLAPRRLFDLGRGLGAARRLRAGRLRAGRLALDALPLWLQLLLTTGCARAEADKAADGSTSRRKRSRSRYFARRSRASRACEHAQSAPVTMPRLGRTGSALTPAVRAFCASHEAAQSASMDS